MSAMSGGGEDAAVSALSTRLTPERITYIAGARSLMYRTIRRFLDERGYLEVDTPALAPALIPEPSIGAFATRYVDEFAGSEDLYLIPSPEVYHKQLLAAGSGSIFEISRCFRNREQLSPVHNPEFSMLEWYSVGANYRDSLELMQELMQEFARVFAEAGLLGSRFASYIEQEPCIMSVHEACMRYGDLDLLEVQDAADFADVLEARGLWSTGEELPAWDELFQRFFLSYVEPELSQDRLVYLTDYPEQIACLAKRHTDEPWRERWELYIGGVEVANCYSELVGEHERSYAEALVAHEADVVDAARRDCKATNPKTQRDYGLVCAAMPEASGNAVGLDRLLMCLLDERNVGGLLLFPKFGL